MNKNLIEAVESLGGTALMGGILIQFSDTAFEQALKKMYEAGVESEREAWEHKYARLQSLMDIRETQPNKPCCLAEREACAEICRKHADFYAGLEPSPIAQSAWSACVDNRDTIRARGQE